MCVVSIIKSCWAEVQQFWVPACLFYKHRFSIDTEWSIFPKTVLIHLINFSTKEILLFFTTAYRDFSTGSFLRSWIHTKRYGLYLEQCHNLTICYTSPSLKSFSYCKLKRCLHWEACRLWIFFHSHKQTYIRYWINTTYKYLFILPYTHHYSQKCLQCTVTTLGLIKTKLCGKHFPTGKHCKTSGHHNVSSPAILFLIVTFPGILGDGPLELSRSQKNFPKSPLTGQIEILTLESLQSRNPIHKFIKIS